MLSGDAQNTIKCIYPNVIFTKLTYSAFETKEDFPTDLNVENKQNFEEGNFPEITPKTKLPSNSVGTDVDMTSSEDSCKDPVNNGYFCRQGKSNDKTYSSFLKKILWPPLQKHFGPAIKTNDAARLLLGMFFSQLPLG